MEKYFTIGEISKLFNLPIKTLRFYDERGLVKPAYINKDNNYRYYSIEQFILIDVIKYSKLMGMSLEEIKNLIDVNLSLENTLDLLDKQTLLLESKIHELSQIKNSIDKVKSQIISSLNHIDNDIFIEFNEERKFISYKYISKTVSELEINLRKAILDIDINNNEVYSSFGTSTSFKLFKESNTIVNNDIRYFINSNNIENFETLPSGNYLSIILDDNSYNKEPYYNKLISYINNNNLEVVGDFNEVWIFPRIGENKKEITLVKIEILLKN